MRLRLLVGLGAVVLFIACPGRLADPNEFLDGGGGSGGGGSGGGGGSDGGCDVEGTLFPLTCANSNACHVAGNVVADGLDLQSPGVKQRLAGTSMCNGLKYKTYMLTKVTSTTPPCGAQMPLGGPYLDSAQIQCLTDYLATVDGGP